MVRRIIYGDNEVAIIANCKSKKFKYIPSKSLKIFFNDDNIEKVKIIIPIKVDVN